MENIALTKPDMAVLKDRPGLAVTAFGVLSETFAERVMERLRSAMGRYGLYSLEYLLEGENETKKAAPVYNIDLALVLQLMRSEKGTEIEKQLTERILERVVAQQTAEKKPRREAETPRPAGAAQPAEPSGIPAKAAREPRLTVSGTTKNIFNIAVNSVFAAGGTAPTPGPGESGLARRGARPGLPARPAGVTAAGEMAVTARTAGMAAGKAAEAAPGGVASGISFSEALKRAQKAGLTFGSPAGEAAASAVPRETYMARALATAKAAAAPEAPDFVMAASAARAAGGFGAGTLKTAALPALDHAAPGAEVERALSGSQAAPELARRVADAVLESVSKELDSLRPPREKSAARPEDAGEGSPAAQRGGARPDQPFQRLSHREGTAATRRGGEDGGPEPPAVVWDAQKPETGLRNGARDTAVRDTAARDTNARTGPFGPERSGAYAGPAEALPLRTPPIPAAADAAHISPASDRGAPAAHPEAGRFSGVLDTTAALMPGAPAELIFPEPELQPARRPAPAVAPEIDAGDVRGQRPGAPERPGAAAPETPMPKSGRREAEQGASLVPAADAAEKSAQAARGGEPPARSGGPAREADEMAAPSGAERPTGAPGTMTTLSIQTTPPIPTMSDRFPSEPGSEYAPQAEAGRFKGMLDTTAALMPGAPVDLIYPETETPGVPATPERPSAAGREAPAKAGGPDHGVFERPGTPPVGGAIGETPVRQGAEAAEKGALPERDGGSAAGAPAAGAGAGRLPGAASPMAMPPISAAAETFPGEGGDESAPRIRAEAGRFAGVLDTAATLMPGAPVDLIYPEAGEPGSTAALAAARGTGAGEVPERKPGAPERPGAVAPETPAPKSGGREAESGAPLARRAADAAEKSASIERDGKTPARSGEPTREAGEAGAPSGAEKPIRAFGTMTTPPFQTTPIPTAAETPRGGWGDESAPGIRAEAGRFAGVLDTTATLMPGAPVNLIYPEAEEPGLSGAPASARGTGAGAVPQQKPGATERPGAAAPETPAPKSGGREAEQSAPLARRAADAAEKSASTARGEEIPARSGDLSREAGETVASSGVEKPTRTPGTMTTPPIQTTPPISTALDSSLSEPEREYAPGIRAEAGHFAGVLDTTAALMPGAPAPLVYSEPAASAAGRNREAEAAGAGREALKKPEKPVVLGVEKDKAPERRTAEASEGNLFAARQPGSTKSADRESAGEPSAGGEKTLKPAASMAPGIRTTPLMAAALDRAFPAGAAAPGLTPPAAPFAGVLDTSAGLMPGIPAALVYPESGTAESLPRPAHGARPGGAGAEPDNRAKSVSPKTPGTAGPGGRGPGIAPARGPGEGGVFPGGGTKAPEPAPPAARQTAGPIQTALPMAAAMGRTFPERGTAASEALPGAGRFAGVLDTSTGPMPGVPAALDFRDPEAAGGLTSPAQNGVAAGRTAPEKGPARAPAGRSSAAGGGAAKAAEMAMTRKNAPGQGRGVSGAGLPAVRRMAPKTAFRGVLPAFTGKRGRALPGTELSYATGPGPGQEAALARETAAGSAGSGAETGETTYFETLPGWAKDFFNASYPPAETSLNMGSGESAASGEQAAHAARGGARPALENAPDVRRDISTLKPPAARSGQVVWEAPGRRMAPADTTLKQRRGAGEAEGRAQPAKLSDAEINRTADKVYQLIEERLRRERRRLGL